MPAPTHYLKLGWHLIPIYNIVDGRCACGDSNCKSAGKHPYSGLGIRHSSKDPDTIQRWYEQWPECNWAVVCNKSGFGVIDVDPRNGGNSTFAALVDKLGPLPLCPTQKTGGDGRHYLLALPPKTKLRANIGPGVDCKHNGYILIEPSNHISGGFYEWITPYDTPIPPMPMSWLDSARYVSPKKSNVVPFVPRYHNQDDLQDLEDALQYIDADDYDTWIQIGMGLKEAVGDSGFGIWDKWSQSSTKYNSTGMQSKWNSFNGKGITKATIFHHASSNGWKPTKRATPSPVQTPQTVTNEAKIIDITPLEDWRHGLIFEQRGTEKRLSKDPGNLALILANDPLWRNCLKMNLFRNRIEWHESPPAVTGLETPQGNFRDHHVIHIQHWIKLHYNGSFSKDATYECVNSCSFQHAYHPVKDYLESIEWDGKQRVADWLLTYYDSEELSTTRSMGMMWLISAVARIYEPGCRVNYMLILEGPQQIGKSSSMKILGGKWYNERVGDLSKYKVVEENIQGFWIIEFGELDSFKGARATSIKSFISTLQDTFRPSYGHNPVDYPRQCVCVGTTNESVYLNDPTGGARFWPVKVTKVHLEELQHDRDQLWAEALQLYRAGIDWWPDEGIQKDLKPLQEERYETDPWEEKVMGFVERQLSLEGFSMADILSDIVQDVSKWDMRSKRRIGGILRRLGYYSKAVKVDGKVIKHWFKG